MVFPSVGDPGLIFLLIPASSHGILYLGLSFSESVPVHKVHVSFSLSSIQVQLSSAFLPPIYFAPNLFRKKTTKRVKT